MQRSSHDNDLMICYHKKHYPRVRALLWGDFGPAIDAVVRSCCCHKQYESGETHCSQMVAFPDASFCTMHAEIPCMRSNRISGIDKLDPKPRSLR